MQENKYYFTNPDHIYGLMRKTLIVVISIHTKIFKYKTADWVCDHETKKMRINKHYERIFHGRLLDSEYFTKLKTQNIIVDIIH